MLIDLHIKNYALIDELHLTFQTGLNVFTGETGAGKSILIDAINLVLGERADSNTIRSGAETSSVEAIFDIQSIKSFPKLLDSLGYTLEDPERLLLRREISRTGKNRCWVEGQLCTLSILQDIGQELVDLHGQHEHQSLLKSSRQLDVLDEYAKTQSLREKVSEVYKTTKEIQEEVRHLQESDADKQTRIALYRDQIREIESAKISENEEMEINQQRQLLRHSEQLVQLATTLLLEMDGAEDTTPGIFTGLGKIRAALIELNKYDTQWEGLIKQIEPLEIILQQLHQEISVYQEKINIDPQKLEEIEERLDLLHRLKRKYRVESIKELINLNEKWKSELDGLSHQEERLEELEKELKRVTQEFRKLCIELSEKRKSTGRKLSKEIQKELTELGMPHATFQVNIEWKEDGNGWILENGKHYTGTSTGMDEVEFLFSANAGEPVKSLSKVISGGELSRVMLALKSIFAKTDKIPTLIFDEIDVGIGGVMASTVSQKLKEISDSRQVLVITHLPVIAAAAQVHYHVSKRQDGKRTIANVQCLTKEERVREIARMTSGEMITEASVTHAKELLSRNSTSTKKNTKSSS